MKRLLLLGVLAAAVLVPAAAASPAATNTLRGTVVAKDRAHRALVVALPSGKVQTVVAPAAFGRTGIGRKVVIRYAGRAGRLPVALGVSLEGQAHRAVVRGTIVRLAKRRTIINAGGSMLNVTLKAPKGQRALASAKSGPKAGDTVKIEVEIDDDGSLDASAIVVAVAPAGVTVGSDGEMEVRGRVTALSPLTVETGGTPKISVGCVVPASFKLNVILGDMIELKCDLIGGVWTVRVAHDEDEHSGSGDDDSAEVEVRGIITALTDTTVTVDAVSCTIPPSVLAPLKLHFAVNDVVEVECVKVGNTLTLKQIEKKGGNSGEHSDDDDDDDDESSDD